MVRIKKDGTRIDVSLTSSLVKDRKGNITGSSSISRDITERKLLEVALAESELRFRSVAQFATDAIIAADNDGRIVAWNNGARFLCSASRSRWASGMLGIKIVQVLRPPPAP